MSAAQKKIKFREKPKKDFQENQHNRKCIPTERIRQKEEIYERRKVGNNKDFNQKLHIANQKNLTYRLVTNTSKN